MQSRSEENDEAIDPRMVNIIEQMFHRCYVDSGEKQFDLKIYIVDPFPTQLEISLNLIFLLCLFSLDASHGGSA